MIKRKIGNSGIEASVIALGTWVMGGWMWGGADERESINAIHASLDCGVDLIDTAPVYGFGVSEEIVGKALLGRRDKAVLATKCGLRWDLEKGDFHFHSDGFGVTKEPSKIKVFKYLGPESITFEVEESLRRLQTDYIDLYQTHWQESTTKIEDTMACLLKLKDDGKIRAIGVSNASVGQMREYGEIDSDQEKYNMFTRMIETNGNLDYCINTNTAVLAYSPLAQGLLTGKTLEPKKYNNGDLRINSPLFKSENLLKVKMFCEEILPFAEEHSCNIGQLVLAWTHSQPGITHLLCGARNPEQAIENSKAGSIVLSKDELYRIDDTFKSCFDQQ